MNINLISLDNINIANNKWFDFLFKNYSICKFTNIVIVSTPIVIFNGNTEGILYIIKLYENYNSNWICFDLSDGKYTNFLINSKKCIKIFNMTNKNIIHEKIYNIIYGYNTTSENTDNKINLIGDDYYNSILYIPSNIYDIYNCLESNSIPVLPLNYTDEIFIKKPYILTNDIDNMINEFKNDPIKLYDTYNQVIDNWNTYKNNVKNYFDKLYNDTFFNPENYGIVGVSDELYARYNNEIIAVTVSTNYADKLSFIIDNAKFFKKWYFVTKSNDFDTINFLKNTKYNNIEILFYDDFHINGAKFNCAGARNFAQNILHKLYPDYWILMLDSDIILPNNFDIYIKDKMYINKLYGLIRYNCNTKNDLINNKYENSIYDSVYSFIGYFQLYFDKTKYYQNFSNYCGDYDMPFICNFKNREIFKNIFCIHLGISNINWDGRIEENW